MTTNGVDDGSRFDRLLEDELRERIGSVEGPSPEVDQSAYQAYWSRRRGRTRGSRIRSLLSRRLMLSLAAGTLLAGSGSVVSMATGGPAGQEARVFISTAVEVWKGQVAGAQNGVGEHVKQVVNERGQHLRADDSRGSSGGGTGGDTNQAGLSFSPSSPSQFAQSDPAGRPQGRNPAGRVRGQGQDHGQSAAQTEVPPGQAKVPRGQAKVPSGQDKSLPSIISQGSQGQGQANGAPGQANSQGSKKHGGGKPDGRGGSQSQQPAATASPADNR